MLLGFLGPFYRVEAAVEQLPNCSYWESRDNLVEFTLLHNEWLIAAVGNPETIWSNFSCCNQLTSCCSYWKYGDNLVEFQLVYSSWLVAATGYLETDRTVKPVGGQGSLSFHLQQGKGTVPQKKRINKKSRPRALETVTEYVHLFPL